MDVGSISITEYGYSMERVESAVIVDFVLGQPREYKSAEDALVYVHLDAHTRALLGVYLKVGDAPVRYIRNEYVLAYTPSERDPVVETLLRP